MPEITQGHPSTPAGDKPDIYSDRERRIEARLLMRDGEAILEKLRALGPSGRRTESSKSFRGIRKTS